MKAFVVPDAPNLVGSVLVSYEEASSAQACVQSYRSVHNKEAEVLCPLQTEPSLEVVPALESVNTENEGLGERATVEMRDALSATTESTEDIAAGVDDFLNSLL